MAKKILVNDNKESRDILEGFIKFHKQNLVILRDGLRNPTPEKVDEVLSKLTDDFKPSIDFVTRKLSIWLPELKPQTHNILADGLIKYIHVLRMKGKPESVFKTFYIKYLCWVKYDLRDVISKLG